MTDKKDPTNAARQSTHRAKQKKRKVIWDRILEAIKALDKLDGKKD